MARDLASAIVGREVNGVTVRKADVLRGITAARFRAKLRGKRIIGVWRRAKRVVLDLGPNTKLIVDPRFTGALVLQAVGTPAPDYSAISISLDDGRTLHYRDIRRLGTVRLLDDAGFVALDAALGVEPLSPAFTADRLGVILGASSSAVKRVLLDQSKIAGIGNIYASEVLWESGINPRTPAKSLSRARITALHRAIPSVLSAAIGAGGTTFRDYVRPDGSRGRYGLLLRAYGRGGEACARKCGSRLRLTRDIDGRATFYCPRCQR